MADALTPQEEFESAQAAKALIPGRSELSADEHYVRPSSPAQYPYGVTYQAEYETEWDGTAVAARRHARALAMSGIPVLLRSFSHKLVDEHGVAQDASQGLPAAVEAEVGVLRRTSLAHQVPVIKHIVIRDANHLRTLIWPRGASAGYDAEQLIALRDRIYANTILFSVWERDSIDPQIAEQLKLLGECWVPCEQNAAMLRAAGVERVRVMPHPYDPADPICRLVARPPYRSGWKLFYAIGRWEPRKGFDLLIEAFLRAFTPEDRALLTLKISGGDWPNYPTPSELVDKLLSDEAIVARGWTRKTFVARVKVLNARKPRSEIIAIHFYNNIYVSASHGEAWNLPAFEAKIAGNRLLHVPFGGTADFAGKDDVSIPFDLGPVHTSYGWEKNAQWAHYGVEDLVAALGAVAPPEVYGAEPDFDRFFLRNVGMSMRDAVLELCARNHPKAARFYCGEKEPEPPQEEAP